MKRIIIIGIIFLSIGLAVGYYFGYDIGWERMAENGEESESQERTVSLYYYNPDLDMDEAGNLLCSQKGLVAVERTIPVTETPIEDTLLLLLEGELTETERSAGVTTEYPLAGFELLSSFSQNGNLTLTFNDPQNQTSGGSCRAGILWSQIEATVMQFAEVESVRFLPEELFQP